MSKLHTVGLALLIVTTVMGVCGLATIATDKTDQLVASTAGQQTTPPNSTVGAYPRTLGSPATDLKTLNNPLSTAPEMTNDSHVPSNSIEHAVACNNSDREWALDNRSQQLHAETARHRHVLRSLQSTGLVTRFLNPYIYSSRVSQEETTHHRVVKQIQHKYLANLARAQCS